MGGSLTGRAVLVTGASSGLGAAFARAFAADGAKVALAARRTDRLEALRDEIAAAGGEAIAVPCDVGDEESVIACYDAVQAAFGPVMSVMNNAGLNSEGLAVDLPVDEFDRVFDINVRGVFLVAREGARRMIAHGAGESEAGRIVNIASIGALKVLPGVTAYCASKAAVVMLTKGLAREWARKGIGVNAICPGYVETEINSDWLASDGGQRMIKGFPRRRLMADADLVPLATYLLGDASRAVTGGVFTVDDGQSL